MISRRSALVAAGLAASSVARGDVVDPVVVRAGTASLHVTDVARRLAAVPSYQLSSLGKNPDEIRRRFVAEVLVPELLYAAEAERRRLESEPHVVARIRDARRRALVDTLRKEADADVIPEDEIRGYFTSHQDDFERPLRIRIARISTDDEALARKIIEEARGAGGPERWSKLAREHSTDEATRMRGGALGFVFPDGRTDVPQLRVDPALYAAASTVRDGELITEPVKEGNHFAVVWRRGTEPAATETFDSARARIREILLRKRLDERVESLLGRLRKQYVTAVDSAPLETPLRDDKTRSAEAPTPRVPGSADPVPKATDRGLR